MTNAVFAQDFTVIAEAVGRPRTDCIGYYYCHFKFTTEVMRLYLGHEPNTP